jgi:hypothetical protein
VQIVFDLALEQSVSASLPAYDPRDEESELISRLCLLGSRIEWPISQPFTGHRAADKSL